MLSLHRHRERARTDRAALDDLLDEVPVGTVSTVADGHPWVVPMLFARAGDQVVVHGSTGAGALRHLAAGAPAVLCVMALDAIVVGPSTFASSANYRSAVVRGRLTSVEGESKAIALDALANRLIPGRPAEVRPMTARELAATAVLALPITEGDWLVKTRSGPPGPPEEDTDAWCGVVPVHAVRGEPEPAPWVPEDVPVPDSVRRLTGIPSRR